MVASVVEILPHVNREDLFISIFIIDASVFYFREITSSSLSMSTGNPQAEEDMEDID